jgi:hypothetical protein
MSRIRDHIYAVMRSGLVHGGKVYSRRGATEGGKGGGRGAGGAIIRD